MNQPEWARTFNLTTAGNDLYHGVEFPSGRVVLDRPESGLACAAVSLDELLATPDMQGATVERPGEAT
jgi:hypothetical protein